MPLSSANLNNAYPPIWLQSYSSGKTVGGIAASDLDPISDANTLYRRIEGHDEQNYFNMQRQGGDLFHRDLVLAEALQRIANYLGQRSGICFNIPDTRIAPLRHVTIASLGNIQTDAESYTGFYVTSCRVVKTTDSGNCGIRVVNGSGSVIHTLTSYGIPSGSNIFTTGALDSSSRGENIVLVDGVDLQIQAYNEHATSEAVVGGFVVLAPKTT
jgi:hypothetical protein